MAGMEPTNHRSAVIEEVLALMGRRRMTQTELAAAMSDRLPKPISQPTLSRRLDGAKPFDIDELFAIADVFGVDVFALFPTPGTSGENLTRSRCVTTEGEQGHQLDLRFDADRHLELVP